MNTTQIKIFLEVAKTNSYSQAAENLYLAQSVVSYNIKNLEKELDFSLFDRDTHSVKLTKAGEIFYQNFVVIDSMIQNTIEKCSALEANKNVIRIGFSGERFLDIAFPLLSNFYHIHPGIKLTYTSYPFPESIRPILSEKEHFMFVFKRECEGIPELEYYPIMECQPCILVSKDNELAKKKKVSINNLGSIKIIILRDDNSGIFKAINDFCPTLKFETCDHIVEEMLDVAVNSKIVISPFMYPETDRMISIPIYDLPKTTRGLAVLKERDNEMVENFVEVLKVYSKQFQ